MPTEAEIVDRLAYHPATPASALLHDAVRTRATEFAVWLNDNLPSSREASLALTTIQETMMWANAAIAVHGAPAATEEQRTTPQPSQGQGGYPQVVDSMPRVFQCPNCYETVQQRSTGHVNPHWETEGYDKNGFTCTKANR